MTERPILFNSDMVRALREGRKTVTRRTRGLEKINAEPDAWAYGWAVDGEPGQGADFHAFKRRGSVDQMLLGCPFGIAGDRLWTRETFYCDDFEYPNGSIDAMRDALDYRATHDCANWEAGCPCIDDEGRGRWRPSIHMPRWASRDTLEVISARPERLHAMDRKDAYVEGIGAGDNFPWSKNPWTWRVEFRRLTA